MKQVFIQQSHLPRLILFFTGWAMDETPFKHYRPQDADLMICYDYRSLGFDPEPLKAYTDIRLVAWSMGVWAASQVLQQLQLPITQSTAINGTPYPVDARKGIPPLIFQGTLAHLDETTLHKFQFRMCHTEHSFEQFQTISPCRPIEELKEELRAVALQQQTLPPSTFIWQQAVIGTNDRIFPPRNQQEAWSNGNTEVKTTNGAHYDETLFQTYLER